ncbi:MAG: hypothetical protein LBB50_04425 [Oscillospiraceae bacterium]|jgi:hypothetical protein|nr:hypothetical protein [Oscillospiraceae bacterium]
MKSAQVFALPGNTGQAALCRLQTAFADLFPTLPTPVVSETPAQLLRQLADHLCRGNVFIVTAEAGQFHALKTTMLSALGFQSYERSQVLHLQAERCPADAAFPASASLFLTAAGRCNGFALRSGQQDLLYLPLHEDLLDELLPQATAYLRSRQKAKAAPPLAPEAKTDVELRLRQLGGRVFSDINPIEPTSIMPFPTAEEEYFGSLGSRPPRKQPQPDAQTAALLARAAEHVAWLNTRRERLALLVSPVWQGIAALSGQKIHITAPPRASMRTLREALDLAAARLQKGSDDWCAVVSAPMPGPEPNSVRVILALHGPSDYARVRELHWNPEEALGKSPANFQPVVAEAVLALLCDSVGTACMPSQAAHLVAAPHAPAKTIAKAPVAALPRRRGRALAAVALLTNLSLFFQGAHTQAADLPPATDALRQ